MPSRFGLRQLVILLIVLGCAAALVVAMVQNNRLVGQQRALQNRVDALEQRDAPPPPSDPAASTTPTSEADWARPGVPVTELKRVRRGSSGNAVGGELVEALESAPQTLTPFFATDAQARRVLQDNVFQTLARLTARAPTATPTEAGLAVAYQADPKGKWLRVRINDRAHFSDGTPVTAEDVKFSLDVLRTPGLQSDRVRSTLDGIESIEVISDRVAEFRFTEPRPLNIPHALSSLYIVPKHYYGKFSADELNRSTGLMMGSGPFKAQNPDPDAQWKAGSDIVLIRDPLGWETSPALDSIRFTVITDSAARLIALRNGDVHIIRPTPDQMRAIDADNSTRSWARPEVDFGIGSSYSAIAWNCGTRSGKPSLLRDRRVRTAMTLLTDRDRIMKEYYGFAASIATNPFPTDSEMSSRLTPLPFDPTRAAQLLDEAGWTSRNAEGVRTDADGRALDIELAIPKGSKLAEFVALMLKDEAAKAGVRIRISTVDLAALTALQREGDFDGAIVSWTHGLPENEPRQQWHSASIADGDNFCQFADPTADQIIELGERKMDENSRMELWHRLDRVLYDNQPCTFLVNPAWVRLFSPDIGDRGINFYGFDYADFAFSEPRPDTSR